MLVPVILCGGSGTRLWPLSREMFPKQFLRLTSQYSLLQETINRILDLRDSEVIVVCNENHRFIVAEQTREIQCNVKIILESEGKNTAAAIGLACEYLLEAYGGSAKMLVLPADHYMDADQSFMSAIENALPLVDEGRLVTFGIEPTSAHTGYGYIKAGVSIASPASTPAYEIESFVEKPDREVARGYLLSREYFWNSGMFLFTAKDYKEELQLHEVGISNSCQAAYRGARQETDFCWINREEFAKCESKSVDYAVFEKTARGAVIPFSGRWNDIGTWPSLMEVMEKEEGGNVCLGDVEAHGTSESLIIGEERLIQVIGLKDMIVIDTSDALLVATKKEIGSLGPIVDRLRKKNRVETKFHREVHRPWGAFNSIAKGDAFQVKRIIVNVGAKLSTQKHFHRSEHWVVLAGTARVLCDGEEFKLAENESTFIPKGSIHSLENIGEIVLEIIEVQCGEYLGEDDIVRFEDRYGRR